MIGEPRHDDCVACKHNANTMWRKLLYSNFHTPKAVTKNYDRAKVAWPACTRVSITERTHATGFQLQSAPMHQGFNRKKGSDVIVIGVDGPGIHQGILGLYI